MIKAVVFDFDGLIIDTETPEYEVFYEIYRSHGIELTIERYSQTIGTTYGDFNPFTYINECLPEPIEESEIRLTYQQRLEPVLEQLEIREGVISYLETAKRLGLKIGLATSSKRVWIDRFFTKHNLHSYFDSISTADDVEKVKPDPALYLRAIDELGVDASEAIAFEDSDNGSKAAMKAGLHCVAVPNKVTNHFDFYGCTMRISSMQDMPLEQLIKRIENDWI